MILTTPQELDALLPANVSTRPERLLTLMEQTERTHILPLLGSPLYQAVCKEYNRLHFCEALDADGQPMDANALVTAQSHHLGYQYTPMQQLIRLLQVPLVYMTLANNTGILSISLNDAGMNLVSADNYDTAKKDDREAFSRDCFRNAHEGMEQVLLFLEEDAHAESPVFLHLWRQSPSFYLQYGLLVTTATRFSQIVPINDSREWFLSLVQRIRFVQDNKVRPEFGDRLTDALVQYAAFGPQPKPKSRDAACSVEGINPGSRDAACSVGGINPESRDAACSVGSTNPASRDAACSVNPFDEDLRSFLPVMRHAGMEAEDRLKLNAWNKLLLMLQQAVCFYTEMDHKKLRRTESERDAMLLMERAKQLVRNNTALFEGVIEDSPLYIPPRKDGGSTPCSTGSSPGGVFDPLGGYYS